MSSRRPEGEAHSFHSMQLRSELQQLKDAHVAAENAARHAETVEANMGVPPSSMNEQAAPTPSFDALSGVEKSAASLGVHPEAWKPIKFLNNAHYDQLMKSNAISEDLARRIEAFRHVSLA